MHERNDETLHRAAHGRAPFGTYHSLKGLDRFLAELRTPMGRVPITFEGRDGLKVLIGHHDPFFRALEAAWNQEPDFGERDVHARFWGLTDPSIRGGFSFRERVELVSRFLTLGASALEALASGQRTEVASLEEHARHLRLNSINHQTSHREAL